MVNALLILAAGAEKSEAPFFVVGCLFGVWAVVIGVLGTRSPSFVNTRGAGTAVIGISVLLAVSAGALIVYVLH